MAERSRRAAGIVVTVLAGLAAACAGTPEVPGAGGPGTTAVALRAEPLALAELRARPALGFDVRVQPVLDPAQLDPAALAAPCGGTIVLPLASAERDVFRSTPALVVEVRAPVPDAAAEVDRVAAAVPPGDCQPPGAPAVTVRSAALPAVGDRRVGWVERRADRSTFVAVVAGAGELALLVVQTTEPFADSEFLALVELAFQPR
jgi:hypothetical protein